jgi:hypothetical protein
METLIALAIIIAVNLLMGLAIYLLPPRGFQFKHDKRKVNKMAYIDNAR